MALGHPKLHTLLCLLLLRWCHATDHGFIDPTPVLDCRMSQDESASTCGPEPYCGLAKHWRPQPSFVVSSTVITKPVSSEVVAGLSTQNVTATSNSTTDGKKGKTAQPQPKKNAPTALPDAPSVEPPRQEELWRYLEKRKAKSASKLSLNSSEVTPAPL